MFPVDLYRDLSTQGFGVSGGGGRVLEPILHGYRDGGSLGGVESYMQILNCIGVVASNTPSVPESFDLAHSSFYYSSSITYILLIFILNFPLGGFGHLAIVNSCLQTRSIDDGELLHGILNILMCWKKDHEDIFLFSWWVILYSVFLRR